MALDELRLLVAEEDVRHLADVAPDQGDAFAARLGAGGRGALGSESRVERRDGADRRLRRVVDVLVERRSPRVEGEDDRTPVIEGAIRVHHEAGRMRGHHQVDLGVGSD